MSCVFDGACTKINASFVLKTVFVMQKFQNLAATGIGEKY